MSRSTSWQGQARDDTKVHSWWSLSRIGRTVCRHRCLPKLLIIMTKHTVPIFTQKKRKPPKIKYRKVVKAKSSDPRISNAWSPMFRSSKLPRRGGRKWKGTCTFFRFHFLLSFGHSGFSKTGFQDVLFAGRRGSWPALIPYPRCSTFLCVVHLSLSPQDLLAKRLRNSGPRHRQFGTRNHRWLGNSQSLLVPPIDGEYKTVSLESKEEKWIKPVQLSYLSAVQDTGFISNYKVPSPCYHKPGRLVWTQ